MSSVSTRLRATQDKVQDMLADMSPRDRTLRLGMIAFGAIVLIGGSIWWMHS